MFCRESFNIGVQRKSKHLRLAEGTCELFDVHGSLLAVKTFPRMQSSEAAVEFGLSLPKALKSSDC